MFRSVARVVGVSGVPLALRQRHNPFLRYAPPGHFYSPLPDAAEAQHALARRPRDVPRTLPGIDTRDEAQLALLEAVESPRRSRYNPANRMFVAGDALALAAVLRRYRPARYIEVGSGYSSAAALDVNDHALAGGMACTFIEPFPERLYAQLTPEDRRRHRILESRAQDVLPDVFLELDAGDVLFIDSSHVAKIGSDVVYLLTDILPRLPAGVLVHIHDIFWPFEYPGAWTREGRAWNELYLVKVLLQHSRRYEILLFNDYLGHFYLERLPPEARDNPGSSLWLRVVPDEREHRAG